MPICEQCGTGLPVGYEYCYQCGYPVRGLPGGAPGQAAGDEAAPPEGGAADAGGHQAPPPGAPAPGWYAPPGWAPGWGPPPQGAPPQWQGQAPGWAPPQGWAGAQPSAAPVALVAQGWPRRLLAFVIDYFIVAIPVGIVGIVAMAAAGGIDLTRQTSLSEMLSGRSGLITTGQQLAIESAMLISLLVYGFVLETTWGTTVGKRALGMRVVNAGDFGRCGWNAVLVRNIFKVAALAVAPFGPLVPLVVMSVDPAWHRRVGDRLGHTLVVREVGLTAAAAPGWPHPPQG